MSSVGTAWHGPCADDTHRLFTERSPLRGRKGVNFQKQSGEPLRYPWIEPREILLPVIFTSAKCTGQAPVTFTCVKHAGDPVASTGMERANGYLHQCEASREVRYHVEM